MRSDLFCAVLYDPLCVLCSLSAYLAAFAAIIVLGQGGAYGMDASHTMEMYVVMGLLTALAFFPPQSKYYAAGKRHREPCLSWEKR